MDAAAHLRETIYEKLRSRTWRAGHRIPTERALSSEFGLSRSTVRRVLQDFKRKRLITQTVGSGTYVAEQVHASVIVVGNKGMTGARRFLLGSVPNKISHHAPCSVYIARTT